MSSSTKPIIRFTVATFFLCASAIATSGLAPSTRDEAAATGAIQSHHEIQTQSGLERSDKNKVAQDQGPPVLHRPGENRPGDNRDEKKEPQQKPAENRPDEPVTFKDLANHFNYNLRAPLNFQQRDVEKRGKVLIIDMEYSGADDDHVPAWLVVPQGDGPFPGIVWGHWMQDKSPKRNRDEFLDEAVALANSGVMSVLIDTPMVRPGYKEESPEKEPLRWAEQFSDTERQYVIDLRRAVDLLLSRRSIDKNRIGYVGHSYSAHAGAILAGVDKRISTFVLMAGTYGDEEAVRAATSGGKSKWRQAVGEEGVNQYFLNYQWDDPAHYLPHTETQSVFLQFASKDETTKAQAQKYLDRFSAKDKKMEFYDAAHALNKAAMLDRDHWLESHLHFKHLDEKGLEAIPQLK
jgi:dienelactone hydrolase